MTVNDQLTEKQTAQPPIPPPTAAAGSVVGNSPCGAAGRFCSRTNSHGTHQRYADDTTPSHNPPTMSETQRPREASARRSPAARESPYPRENYFASIDDEYDTEREPLDETRNDHHLQTLDRGTSKDEWIVATLQKGQATMLCPYALNESPDTEWALHESNGEVVLGDPSEYPPPATGFVTPETDTAARKPSTSRWRYNPEHGYLVFGGIPRDQSREDFLAFVEERIDAIEADPLEGERDAALELAGDLKSRGDRSDSDICELIVQKLLSNESICEFVASGNY